MRKLYPILTLAAVLVACDEDTVTPPEAQTSPVLTFADQSQTGTSNLTRTPNGIQFDLDASELEPGTGVTLWVVVFNKPENCATSPCGEPDLANADVMPDVLNGFAGQEIPASGDGTFTGSRAANDAQGSVFGAAGGASYGIMDPETAEIHFVLRSHGPLLEGFEDEQTETFNGGCQHPGMGLPNPLPESLGTPGPNTCADIQFAVHQPN